MSREMIAKKLNPVGEGGGAIYRSIPILSVTP